MLKEVLWPIEKTYERLKRIRGVKTLWKCTEYAVPICRPGRPYWNIAHRRLFGC